FLANLGASGIHTRRLTVGFYSVSGLFPGFLRIANEHCSIAEKRGSLPGNLPNPTKGNVVAALLAKKFDVGLMVKNDKQAAADQAARRKDFQKVKDNLTEGLKRRPDEISEDFELRKRSLLHSLAELERFIAESAELTLGWTTDAPKKEARLDFELTTIPGSSLETSAKLLGQAPGMFASVPRSADAIFSVRVNFPLDDLRKTNVLEAIKQARTSAGKHIDAAKGKTAEQKDAQKETSEMWFDMLNAVTNTSGLDAMIEVSQASGEKANLVFGFKAPNGNDLKPIVELIPKIWPDYKVQLNVEAVDGVTIHSISVPEKNGDFEQFFGKGTPIHVGTGPNSCWIAIGAKSLDQLKAAIGAAGNANVGNANNFLTIFGKAGPWIEHLDTRRARLDAIDVGKKLTEAEAKAKKDREATRKLALEAFKAGKDTWETNLDANAGKITGSTRFDEGLLRFLGSAISKFS
ncbi:MAG TPA: hypothetical protein VK137_16340, partial [Planctomycetaceae bacterium]|nr:hypothetical protein [Planctomycetaceae bacterium]